MGTFDGFAGLQKGIKAVYTNGINSYSFVGYDSMDYEYIVPGPGFVSMAFENASSD